MGEKPKGVIIIGALLLFGALVSYYNALQPSKYFSGYSELILIIIGFSTNITFIVASIGLLFFKEWARKLVIILSIIDLGIGTTVAVIILFLDATMLIYSIIAITWLAFFYLIIIWYLMKEEIKETFS